MSVIVNITNQVRKLKSEHQLSLKTPLATLTVTINDLRIANEVTAHDQLIRGVTQATKIVYEQGEHKNSELKTIDEVWHAQVVIE